MGYKAVHNLLKFRRNTRGEKSILFWLDFILNANGLSLLTIWGSPFVVDGLLLHNKDGTTCQGRTDDILITSEALYQLS